MNLIHVTTLTDRQKTDITTLTDACKQKEPLSLSAPSEDGLDYFLLYEKDESSLLAFGFLFFPQETSCECAVFVHPSQRRKGYFSRILNAALDHVEAIEKKTGLPVDFCFLTDEKTPSAMKTMEAIEAEYWYSEHKMVRKLTKKDSEYISKVTIAADSSSDSTGLYTAALDGQLIGTCAILPAGQEYYFYAFQIKDEFQGKGYGKDFLLGMLALLSEKASAVSLQVSGQNYIARNLYKKTGFKTTESLSYYLY